MAGRPLNDMCIGGWMIGPAHPPVFWPDIDIYFNRDEDEARALIKGIADAGCTFLKGAVLQRSDLVQADAEIQYFNHVTGQAEIRNYRDILEEAVVPLDMLGRLIAYGRSLGLSVVLSVYDDEGIDFCVAQKVDALKIPSSNITYKWLIEKAVATGLPLVIDTGRSAWNEIAQAVATAKAAGAEGRLMVQHSPPGPPAGEELFNMEMIAELGRAFDVPVGLSDHHGGLDMVPIAIALGACAIEKGLVLSKREGGIDRAHSLALADLPEAIAGMQAAWKALGAARRPREQVPAKQFDRMGCVAAHPLAAGTVLQAEHLGFMFPNRGIGAEDADALLGRRLIKSVGKGETLNWDLLENAPEHVPDVQS